MGKSASEVRLNLEPSSDKSDGKPTSDKSATVGSSGVSKGAAARRRSSSKEDLLHKLNRSQSVVRMGGDAEDP